MTADAAVRGIRQVDPDGAIGLVGQEPDPPYNRPPLSKGLWKRMPLSRIWRNTANLGAELHLGRTVVALHPGEKRIVDDKGQEYHYEILLLATGGEPIRLAPDSDRLIAFRTLADYQRLRALTETAQKFCVIGGGFIGSEMAAVLAEQGKEVTMIFPENAIGARVLPGEIARHLNDVFRDRGVIVKHGEWVRAVSSASDSIRVQTDSETLVFDAAVAGLGIRPNTQLAQAAGLDVGEDGLSGIRVNAYLRTNHPDIYAAGDVALFHNPLLDLWLRVEHEEHANLSGQSAGMNMAGAATRYDHLPSVYSKVFHINYDAVGDLDPRHAVVYDWQEPFVKGAVYYLSDQRVRGVLLWNISGGLDKARELISDRTPKQPEELRNLFA